MLMGLRWAKTELGPKNITSGSTAQVERCVDPPKRLCGCFVGAKGVPMFQAPKPLSLSMNLLKKRLWVNHLGVNFQLGRSLFVGCVFVVNDCRLCSFSMSLGLSPRWTLGPAERRKNRGPSSDSKSSGPCWNGSFRGT